MAVIAASLTAGPTESLSGGCQAPSISRDEEHLRHAASRLTYTTPPAPSRATSTSPSDVDLGRPVDRVGREPVGARGGRGAEQQEGGEEGREAAAYGAGNRRGR